MSATRADINIRRPFRPPGCQVDPTAFVDVSCRLAPNVWIGPNVTIFEGCEIGPGSVIGWDGFGYEWSEQRHQWTRKPQSCGVRIGPNVHIGANVCIDRGSYRDTVVGEGCRIDNLVHIAHNVIVRDHTLVIAKAELSGSVEVGKRCWIGPAACVREHLKIGDGALVGIGAVVVKDVPAGETWAGNPAKRLDKCCGQGCSRCKRGD